MASLPVSFIGISDHIKEAKQPFPFGSIDIFQLSQHKSHIIYPALTTDNQLVFLINREFAKSSFLKKLKIRIVDEEGKELCNFKMTTVSNKDEEIVEDRESSQEISIYMDISSMLLHVKLVAIVTHPGRYIVQAKTNGEFDEIGAFCFYYQPTPPLTADQIKAIESDPNSAKAVRVEMGCRDCPTTLSVYAALERHKKFEEEGSIWQHDVQDEFICKCGKQQYSLKYIKESLHGLLLKRLSSAPMGISYERRYGHSQVVAIIDKYNNLLNTEKDEKPFQTFIENNPILLAMFHAKRLFIRPGILGKYKTDFVILNSSNELLVIELEKPSIKLFKKDGHPTAELMHAYGQVRDWIHEYDKHPMAVIEGLHLKNEKIMKVKGVVIAGRLLSEVSEPLQRHLSGPPYPNIEFLTLDDLSRSLLEISRKLA